MKYIFNIIICFCLSFYISNSWAAVYKHTDSGGKVHFSDQPFEFKQNTLAQVNKAKRLKVGYRRHNRDKLFGRWQLSGNSTSSNGLLVQDKDEWTFNEDGSFDSSTQGLNIGTTQFRYQNNHLEINPHGKWQSYTVLELNDKNLVLKSNSEKLFSHFRRVGRKNNISVTSSYYSRDQVAKVVAMIACGEIMPQQINQDLAIKQQKNIFLSTGIVDFDDKKFVHSVQYFARDATFKDIYQPKINESIKKCSR